MEDIFDGAWRESFVARDPAVEAELARLIDVRGPALVEQSARLREALTEACPDAQRHVAVLLAAVSAGVAKRLRAGEDDPDVPRLLERCVADLQAHGVADPEWAWWAVRTWAHAFALPTGAVAPVARDAPGAGDAQLAAIAPWVTNLASKGVEPVVEAEPDPHEPDEAVDAAAPMFADRHPDFATAVEPAAPPVGEPALQVEPLFTDRDLEQLARDRPPAMFAAGDAPTADGAVVGGSHRGRRTLVALAIGLPLAALMGFFLSRWLGTEPAKPADPVVIATTPAPPTAADLPGPSAATATDASKPADAPGAPPAAAASPTKTDEPAAPTTPVAASPARPAIAGIEAPRIVDGAPFVVVIEIAGDASDVVAIERRATDRAGAWPRDATLTSANGLRRAGNALLVRFGAMKAPAMATMEFTAVMRDGSRSEPRAATLVVAPRAQGVGSRDATREEPRNPASCTASSCGRVVETREVEADGRSSGPLYAVVVQLDDHERFTFTAPYRPPLGTRMRKNGSTFAPAGS